jgi:hypothetical protein
MKLSPVLIRPPFRILAAALGLAMIFGGLVFLKFGLMGLVDGDWKEAVALLVSPVVVLGVLLLVLSGTGRFPSRAVGPMDGEIDERAMAFDGRALHPHELEVLALVQTEWGPQNTEQSIQFVASGEAQLWVHDRSGDTVLFLSVTNLADWHRDGSLTREKLLESIRGPRVLDD